MWNVEKIVSKGDYNYAIVRNHPARTKNDYVLEHRVVMENHLSRLLNTNEVVHHINHNKKDNRIENLYIMDKKEHNKILSTTGRKYFILKCPHCHIIFYRERRNSLLANKSQASFCSRLCNGSFSRNMQLCGKTVEMENAISENLVLEYIKFNDNSEEII